MNATTIRHHNSMQAHVFKTRAFLLSHASKNNWDVTICDSVYENKTQIVLTKDGVMVHATFSPEAMATYMDALIALEGE